MTISERLYAVRLMVLRGLTYLKKNLELLSEIEKDFEISRYDLCNDSCFEKPTIFLKEQILTFLNGLTSNNDVQEDTKREKIWTFLNELSTSWDSQPKEDVIPNLYQEVLSLSQPETCPIIS